jgi:hypothetical protein
MLHYLKHNERPSLLTSLSIPALFIRTLADGSRLAIVWRAAACAQRTSIGESISTGAAAGRRHGSSRGKALSCQIIVHTSNTLNVAFVVILALTGECSRCPGGTVKGTAISTRGEASCGKGFISAGVFLGDGPISPLTPQEQILVHTSPCCVKGQVFWTGANVH